MPHDKNGKLVNEGDIVNMKFKVTQVYPSDEYCNVNLESVEGMPPSGSKTTLSAVNTKQVEVEN